MIEGRLGLAAVRAVTSSRRFLLASRPQSVFALRRSREPAPTALRRPRLFSSEAVDELQRKVLGALKQIHHPNYEPDIVFLGIVKEFSAKIGPEGATVSVAIEPDNEYRTLKKAVQEAVKKLPGVSAVRVSMAPVDSKKPQPPGSQPAGQGNDQKEAARPKGLENIKNIIAVASCKGGVGKSTVAVNLAYTLAQMDFKVGILDADIYGPSLPTLISQARDTKLFYNQVKQLIPPVYEGVKCMSFGFVKTGTSGADPNTGLAVIRGPIVSQMATELASYTSWGDLDFLLVDFPPGTGDIQISLSQQLKMDAAIVVTTPSKLAHVDVVKGIQMFDKVRVPTICVVNNLSSFICSNCGHEHWLWGKGYIDRVQEEYGINLAVNIPQSEELARSADNGDPLVLDQSPDTQTIRDAFGHLASGFVKELVNVKLGPGLPTVTAEDQHVKIDLPGQEPIRIANRFLRSKCKCALCVNEFTGTPIQTYEKTQVTVKALSIEKSGNYAVGIKWSDGHNTSLYPYETLLAISRDEVEFNKTKS